jgi:hypothetical protein
MKHNVVASPPSQVHSSVLCKLLQASSEFPVSIETIALPESKDKWRSRLAHRVLTAGATKMDRGRMF